MTAFEYKQVRTVIWPYGENIITDLDAEKRTMAEHGLRTPQSDYASV